MATIRKREGKKGVSYQIDYFDPNGKRVRKSSKKKKDAEAELEKLNFQKAEGRYLKVKKDLKTYLGSCWTSIRRTSRIRLLSFRTWKKYCIEKFRNHFGGDTKLANIRYVGLESYRN